MTHTEALRALLSAVDMLTYPGEDQPQDPEPWGDWNNGNGDLCGPAMAAAIARARKALAQPSAPSAEPAERTLLEQYDREQLPGYRAGYEDGRQRGYTVGHRHGLEQTAAYATAPAQEDREARDALAQAWAALPVWLLNHPGVQAVYRAELAALTQQPSAAPAKRTLQGQRLEELEAARAPAVPADVLRDAERYRWLCSTLGET